MASTEARVTLTNGDVEILRITHVIGWIGKPASGREVLISGDDIASIEMPAFENGD